MHRCYGKNYRFISVMFWAFPYLLWQAFGNISGFVVGVILAVVLTAMLNNLFRTGNWNVPQYRSQQPARIAEPHRNDYQMEPYQRGYQAQTGQYRGDQQPYQAQEIQPQYEEMQVQYPQEMPPMEQS